MRQKVDVKYHKTIQAIVFNCQEIFIFRIMLRVQRKNRIAKTTRIHIENYIKR